VTLLPAKNSNYFIEQHLRGIGSWERLVEMENRLEKTPCKVGSDVCSILKAHHEVLSDDPERLTTEFCIGLVCGEEGLQKYHAKK
jgi:hypothetical protein